MALRGNVGNPTTEGRLGGLEFVGPSFPGAMGNIQPMRLAAMPTMPIMESAVQPAIRPVISTSTDQPAVRISPNIPFRPVITRPDIFRPFQPLPFPPQIFLPPIVKTTTQLARGAIRQLSEANRDTLEKALNSIRSRPFTAAQLINTLERRVKIGEVLNRFAEQWSDETIEDFTSVFREADTPAIRNSIISVAILNDPDLEDELRIENTPETTDVDLLGSRRVVWQYPSPGTPLNPPYLVLVAVENQDVASSEEVVQEIMGQLVTHDGIKIPEDAARKLR